MSHASLLNQLSQLENPDARISLQMQSQEVLLLAYCDSYEGLGTGDLERFSRNWWECPRSSDWSVLRGSVDTTNCSAGLQQAVLWEGGKGVMVGLGKELGSRPTRGFRAWKHKGVAINRMRDLPSTLYHGELFDCNIAAVIPKEPELLPAIWCCISSPNYVKEVRKIDQALKVTNVTLLKIPFDLDHWRKVADELYPDGLPEPHSDDPTQWLFRGDIPSSTVPLQVAVAKLLGFRWPEQPEEPLDTHADEDGIVTLAPLVNQDGIAGRLRALLQAAYESEPPARPKGAPKPEEPRVWNESVIPNLLAQAGSTGMSLEEWLRDKFFDGHTKLFQQRPFIWHIWDGRKDGFHAFVNYHKLDRKNLERLTHVYLGEWIERQRAASESGDRTADARLIAAQELQKKLELIRTAEPPYDIFVRWKSLAEQPMGWDPDLNDGVRMNIRPFVEAGILRGRVNVNWNKDRGKDPKSNVSGTVERHNDLHFTLAEKRAAREAKR